MSKVENHIHKYQREKLGKLVIYRCMVPGCSHYVHKNLAVNRISICWYCDTPFVMTKKSVKLKKPHCQNCSVAHNAKPRPAAETASTFLETVLPNVVEK